MYEAEDHEFFDVLYQQWSKTTWAEGAYWMPELVTVDEDDRYNDFFGHKQYWDILAVKKTDDGDERKWIASVVREEDADFITGLHGALPDLIRRLHEAIDEAERKDTANDIAQGQLAEALLESQSHQETIMHLEDTKGMYLGEIRDLRLENHGLREEIARLEDRLEEEGQR